MLDIARMRRVIEIAAEQSGWAKKKPGNGRALGIAVHRSFLTYVATVVEVEVDNGKIRIPRVDIALDTGKVIHPDRVRAQFEGAAVFGTSIALMGEITAANGRVSAIQLQQLSGGAHERSAVETHVHIVPSPLRRRASASPAFRRCRPPSAMRFSRPPANGSASCRSRSNWRSRLPQDWFWGSVKETEKAGVIQW